MNLIFNLRSRVARLALARRLRLSLLRRNWGKLSTAGALLVLSLGFGGCGGGEGDATEPASAAGSDQASPAADAAGLEESLPAAVSGRASVQAAASTVPQLTVRAYGSPALGVWPQMQVRVNGAVIGSVAVTTATPTNYAFSAPGLRAGAKVDVAFTNDAYVNGEDRNLFVAYLSDGTSTVWPPSTAVTLDAGVGAAAFDGLKVSAGQNALYGNGALRMSWPAASTVIPPSPVAYAAARFLQQATFGPTPAEIQRLRAMTYGAWLNEQTSKPVTPDFVNAVQAQYAKGDAWRPKGESYSDQLPGQHFWAAVASAPDPLRKRMAFALHEIFMISQVNSDIWAHSRAYANYLDQLNRLAFGNYRELLEEMALSPAMGIYLSHLRNRKEDPATGRLPDENFAREIMQLFSIGLVELNLDGTPKLGADGKPIDTYTNADVMALAKVFTGWSWGFPDNQLTENQFRWGWPSYASATDTKVDLQRMKAYPGQHSPAEKRLFTGKAWVLTIPAGSTAPNSLRMALDTLFNHPNVGPFISRQLIQHLTTAHPSPAYVARVAARFNNNGRGVRGDLKAVLIAILLDTEARAAAPAAGFGKLKEPVLRVAQWMRAFDARSSTGEFMMAWELDGVLQKVFRPPTVFGYFRPGYVPPGSTFAKTGATVPEMQIANESTTARWINLAESLSGTGLGWTGQAHDVSASYASLAALSASGQIDAMIEQINLLLLAGQMSSSLRADVRDAIAGVSGSDAASHINRARVAVFVVLASPDFVVQR